MKILYFERHHGNSYSYYNEIKNALAKKNTIYQYTRWSPVGGPDLEIKNVLSSCPDKPDFILFGFGWTDCSENYPKKVNGIKDCGIPVAVILNKEYAALDKKLDWIKNMKPEVAFCVHHDYEQYSRITGVPFHQIPFAVNPNIFKKYDNQEYDCDFGFSGVIRPEQTNDWRAKIVEKSKEWNDINFSFSQHRHDSLESYAKRLNRAKAWLSTTGPADLVGTRYYEVMALGTTLLVCNRFDKVYDDIIEEDEHCIMFSSVEELESKIKDCLQNPNKMKSIIDRAKQHTLKYHTWDNRAEKINKILKEIIG